jgi:hypothetical protein
VQTIMLALVDLCEELLELDPNVRLADYLPAVGLWQILDLA